MSPAARILAGAVRVYRGVREVRPGLPTCRYIPSCSAYGLEALSSIEEREMRRILQNEKEVMAKDSK